MAYAPNDRVQQDSIEPPHKMTVITAGPENMNSCLNAGWPFMFQNPNYQF